ncbi:hypothetical protein AWB95_00795 [Mycobacterium celatum]|uniref:DUF222 domain-containing protein n=1 Tax=Mycobacterium celatum TaxID=28045 RepID=A0A1X1RWV0_MYCCE|nr:hypothetical protein AWB95_00795 [Mycobacterium celatum]
MFDEVAREAVVARFDELFERHYPTPTRESAVLLDRICAGARAENRAAAAQLVAIGELFAYRLSRCSDTEEWAIDTEAAVAAEVAAALRISQGLAGSRLRYARAMRERLPKLGAVFGAGDVDFRVFQTIVYRTDLITDREVLAGVDAQLALAVPRWPSMTQSRLAGQVDKIAIATFHFVNRQGFPNVLFPVRQLPDPVCDHRCGDHCERPGQHQHSDVVVATQPDRGASQHQQQTQHLWLGRGMHPRERVAEADHADGGGQRQH